MYNVLGFLRGVGFLMVGVVSALLGLSNIDTSSCVEQEPGFGVPKRRPWRR